MLNGIDPIILFQFKKLLPDAESLSQKIPVVAKQSSAFPLPIIPIYLSETLTGIFITQESKNIDIDTEIDAQTSGAAPVTNQRPIQSTVKIEMEASSGSLGVLLFSALADLILPKVTSKEYSITYLHGAVTVFDGLLGAFSVTQNDNDDRYNISIEIIKPKTTGPVAAAVPVVTPVAGAVPL